MSDGPASNAVNDAVLEPPTLPYASGRRRGDGRFRDLTEVWMRLAVVCGLITVATGCVGAALTGAGHGTYSVLYVACALALLTAGLVGMAAISHRDGERAAGRRRRDGGVADARRADRTLGGHGEYGLGQSRDRQGATESE